MMTKTHCIALLLLLILVGCATTTSVWHKTQQLNTLEAYQDFLRKYPQSEFAAVANRRIEKLTWEASQRRNTIEAYQDFLRKYPQSEFAAVANRRIEKLTWEASQRRNTIEAYQDFLRKYPQSKFAAVANRRIEKLTWEASQRRNTIEAYQDFLRKYPQSEFAEQARKKLEALHFDQAKTTGTIHAYEDFLAKYPNGSFTVVAKRDLQLLIVRTYVSSLRNVCVDITFSEKTTEKRSKEQLRQLKELLRSSISRRGLAVSDSGCAAVVNIRYGETFWASLSGTSGGNVEYELTFTVIDKDRGPLFTNEFKGKSEARSSFRTTGNAGELTVGFFEVSDKFEETKKTVSRAIRERNPIGIDEFTILDIER